MTWRQTLAGTSCGSRQRKPATPAPNEATQPPDPPACDLLRNDGIAETSISGVGLPQRAAGIDPLVRRLVDAKPTRRHMHHIRVRSDATDNEIDEEAQSVLPARLSQAGNEGVGVVQAIDRGVHAFVIAREKIFPSAPGANGGAVST